MKCLRALTINGYNCLHYCCGCSRAEALAGIRCHQANAVTLAHIKFGLIFGPANKPTAARRCLWQTDQPNKGWIGKRAAGGSQRNTKFSHKGSQSTPVGGVGKVEPTKGKIKWKTYIVKINYWQAAVSRMAKALFKQRKQWPKRSSKDASECFQPKLLP